MRFLSLIFFILVPIFSFQDKPVRVGVFHALLWTGPLITSLADARHVWPRFVYCH